MLEPSATLPSRDHNGIYQFAEPSSHILHSRAREYHWQGEGTLSIKTFSGGRALYNAGGGSYAVDDASYLVLNEGQPYEITIESLTEVESFCVFFAPGLAQEVYHGLTTPLDGLLDDTEGAAMAPPRFFERTNAHDRILSPALRGLKAEVGRRSHDQAGLDERFRDLIVRLLQVHHNLCGEVAALPAARAATREELYRRLHRARDYAHAYYDQRITLDDMARAAGLSPTHLLRTFRGAFGQTPYQYVIASRLERAQKLLRETDTSVTEICFALGFESLGSFSWSFRRRVGLSPEAYRRTIG